MAVASYIAFYVGFFSPGWYEQEAMTKDVEKIINDAGNWFNDIKKFIPSLGNQVASDRPVNLGALVAPWEAAAIFASESGEDDQGAGGLVDPIVLHNTETDGYLAVITQSQMANSVDRGKACVEFINNWVAAERELLAVDPASKLTTTWGREKTRY